MEKENASALTNLEWARARDGWLSGVCLLFARRLKIPVAMVRIAWILAAFLFGSGIFSYFIFAISLPLQGGREKAYRKRFLGVCRRISLRTGHEIGLIRLLAVLSFFVSAGASLLIYIMLNLLMPEQGQSLPAE